MKHAREGIIENNKHVMKQLTEIFDGQELRIVEKGGQPWFVAKDVSEILGFSDTNAMTRHLDDDETMSVKLTGMNMNSTLLNEPGLYSSVIRSRRPEAKRFKRWITHEIIPSIRKHGGYLTPEKVEEALLNPDTLIQLATNLKEEQEKRKQAEQTIAQQKPKVIFAEAVETSKSSILVGELAKILKQNGLDIGQNRLFDWLRIKGFLIKKQGESFNLPTQKSMDLGLFEIKKRTINEPNGSTKVTRTTKVTGKGQVYFIDRLLRRKESTQGEQLTTEEGLRCQNISNAS